MSLSTVHIIDKNAPNDGAAGGFVAGLDADFTNYYHFTGTAKGVLGVTNGSTDADGKILAAYDNFPSPLVTGVLAKSTSVGLSYVAAIEDIDGTLFNITLKSLADNTPIASTVMGTVVFGGPLKTLTDIVANVPVPNALGRKRTVYTNEDFVTDGTELNYEDVGCILPSGSFAVLASGGVTNFELIGHSTNPATALRHGYDTYPKITLDDDTFNGTIFDFGASVNVQVSGFRLERASTTDGAKDLFHLRTSKGATITNCQLNGGSRGVNSTSSARGAIVRDCRAWNFRANGISGVGSNGCYYDNRILGLGATSDVGIGANQGWLSNNYISNCNYGIEFRPNSASFAQVATGNISYGNSVVDYRVNDSDTSGVLAYFHNNVGQSVSGNTGGIDQSQILSRNPDGVQDIADPQWASVDPESPNFLEPTNAAVKAFLGLGATSGGRMDRMDRI